MYEYVDVEAPDRRRYKTVHAEAVKDAVGKGWRGFRVGADDPEYGGEGRNTADVADEHRKDLIRAGHANQANVTVKVGNEPDEDGKLPIQFSATPKGTKPRKAAAGQA